MAADSSHMDDSADADVGIHVSRMLHGLSVMWPMIISLSGSKKKVAIWKIKKKLILGWGRLERFSDLLLNLHGHFDFCIML